MTATLEPTTTASGVKAATGASPADVVRKAKEAGVQVVDLRFTDLPGTWQHFSIPLKELSEELFAEGIGFDGSSIRGFQAINESDMLLFPDPASALDRKSTRLNSSHLVISYAVFCLKKKKINSNNGNEQRIYIDMTTARKLIQTDNKI